MSVPNIAAPPDADSQRRLVIVAEIAALRAQTEEIQATLEGLLERYALTLEERQGLHSEEQLLIQDDAPGVLLAELRGQERQLLREAATLGQEILYLVRERRQVQNARVALLMEQQELLGAMWRRWPWRP
jgi:hypothetical protein